MKVWGFRRLKFRNFFLDSQNQDEGFRLFLHEIADATLIELYVRRNNEKVESLMDEVLEVEEE